ncbi:hypothetical protein BGX23_006399 [Mortierella sp. AD031]|nr:hypothetical protein BGX23_006399 [Mortierella sp. AD031]KAG0220243.1 hypothetical protein BGX33_005603 [Mortierella sp. NVP41]
MNGMASYTPLAQATAELDTASVPDCDLNYNLPGLVPILTSQDNHLPEPAPTVTDANHDMVERVPTGTIAGTPMVRNVLCSTIDNPRHDPDDSGCDPDVHLNEDDNQDEQGGQDDHANNYKDHKNHKDTQTVGAGVAEFIAKNYN